MRHGAATLLLAAGHDMKVVQETLGLSSITIAADTYTSVLPQLAHQSAEDVAALLGHATLTGQIEASQQEGLSSLKERGRVNGGFDGVVAVGGRA